MRRLLSAVFPRASAKALRSAALLTLLLVLVAHGFCFTNLTYSGASVMLNAAKGSSTNAAMPAKLGPPGTGAQAGDPSTMKKEAPTTNWE